MVANVQTSKSMSMREENEIETTTPYLEDYTDRPSDAAEIRERPLGDFDQPSLTSLFDTIDISYNDSENNVTHEEKKSTT